MTSAVRVLAAGAALAGLLALQESDPHGGPVLPPGHPAVRTAPDVAADPQDVASIPAIVEAYYESISAAPDAARNWDRFRSLFLPEGLLVTIGPGDADAALALTPDQFVRVNRAYFEKSGYVEREIRRATDAFGRIAHVLSTYEAARGGPDAAPYSRGINSMQLLKADGRWWIAGVLWDRERDGAEIPRKYLPEVTE